MEQQSLFQQAKQRMMEMMNMSEQGQVTSADKDSVQHALQAAYEEATPEEKQELQQLEQQLRNNQQL